MNPDPRRKMRKRRNSFGISTFADSLRWRRRDPGLDSLGGGNAPTPVSEPDVAPSNGGPERDFDSMSSATIDEPGNPTPNPAAPAPAARVPADPNQRAGITQPSQPAAPVAAAAAATQWQSIREAAAAQGFRFDGTVTDDRTALNFLLAQAQRGQQENVYAQLGRQLAPQAQGIQQYLQQQTQPQAATPARQPWEAPEFDERWAALVTLNEATGLYTSNQGVSHEIAQKVNAFVEWKKGYDRNPTAVINGMVEARAKAVAAETFREQFAEQAQQQTVNAIVTENSSWMYQLDQGGQRMRDYQGQYIPTPVGAAYITQLQNVQRMGVTDPRQQDTLAKQLVRGQIAQAAQQQAWAAQQQAANPATAAAVHQPNVNPLQAAPPASRQANPHATDPSEVGLSLAERMRRDLAASGTTDADIYASSTN